MTEQAVLPKREPIDHWFPSRWGAEDEAGALNEITPAKTLEAVLLVRRGVVRDLAHVLHENVPASPGRTSRQYLTTNHSLSRRPSTRGHGIVVIENLRLDEVAKAGLTEFLLVVCHAKIRGATGAWVCPLPII